MLCGKSNPFRPAGRAPKDRLKTSPKLAATPVLMLAMAYLLCSPATARADVVQDWNAIAVATTAGNPFTQARFLAITQLAVFEAVNATTGTYEPYLGTIVAPVGASAEAAAIAAAHRVLSSYFPASAATLDAARATSLAGIPNGPAKTNGIATGEAAATAMVMLRVNDGSSVPRFYLPDMAIVGKWQVTPSCPAAGGVFLHWRTVTPFGVERVSDFMPEPPPSLNTSRYTADFLEVKTVGSINSLARPQHRTDVARFYAASSPSFALNWAARQVATAQQRSLEDNARSLALLNMAISDSLVASFNAKYRYLYWRPETAIRAADADGNSATEVDLTFTPLILTPCFPSYPSNHASGSGGGAEMLRRLYGEGGHSIVLSNPNVPGVTLSYDSFSQITADVDDARVYGGIHFRFDQTAGGELGRKVATYIHEHNLAPKNP